MRFGVFVVSSMSTPISVHKDKPPPSREMSCGSNVSNGRKPPFSSSPSFSHSTRIPPAAGTAGTVVLDLMTLRPKEQTSAVGSVVPDDTEGHQNSIEECILETFQRIDAQNSSNSFEEEDPRMSIIENPLSEGVAVPISRLDTPPGEPLSDLLLLNSRVDQLAK